MALNYTTLTALIKEHYLPRLYDQIFVTGHYLAALLKQKAKTFDERKIVVPLEYGKMSQIAFIARYGTVPLKDEEIATAAEYAPKMLSGSITIPLEDELQSRSDGAIKKILDAKFSNLKRSLQEYYANHIWARGTSVSDGNAWNTIDHLVNAASVTVGGIAAGTYTWWKANALDLTSSPYTDDPTDEAELIDPAKDVYLLKIIQRLIATSQRGTGEKPDVILCPQYIYDLIEGILEEKRRLKMSDRAAKLGVDAISYRGVDIAADDDMVENQAGDTDGRMYALNTNYLYMFFNSGAKFTMTDWVRPANSNYRAALINAYGNMVTTNRRCQSVATGLASPKTYANPNSV